MDLRAERHDHACDQILDFIARDSQLPKTDWAHSEPRENESIRLRALAGRGILVIPTDEPDSIYALYRGGRPIQGTYYLNKGIREEIVARALKFEKGKFKWQREVANDFIVTKDFVFEGKLFKSTPVELAFDQYMNAKTAFFLPALKVTESNQTFASDFDIGPEPRDFAFLEFDSELDKDIGEFVGHEDWGLINSSLLSDFQTPSNLVIAKSKSGRIFAWDAETRKLLWKTDEFKEYFFSLGFSLENLSSVFPNVLIDAHGLHGKRKIVLNGSSGRSE